MMASINDYGGPQDPLDGPGLGGPGGWAEAVAQAITALQAPATSTRIGDGQVTSAKLAPGAVQTTGIGDGQVTSAKLAPGLVLPAATPNPVMSATLVPALSGWTPVGGAAWDGTHMTMPPGSSITAPLHVTAGQVIQLDATGHPTTGDVTFGVGGVSVTVPAGHTPTLVAGATGDVTATVAYTVAGSLTDATVRALTSPASVVTVAGVDLRASGANTALGYSAQSALTTGSSNTAVGRSAQSALTTGSYNTALGYTAQSALTTGSSNTALGHSAQSALTTGSANTALGHAAQWALTTGSSNTALGYAAQSALTTGSSNTALGYYAQRALTTGSYNTALGYSAQSALTTGSSNTAVGYYAQRALTTGSDNTALGYAAQSALTTGSSNTALGYYAQVALTTGSYNAALGHKAGSTVTTQSGTVCIGTSADGTKHAEATADNQVVLGTDVHTVLLPGQVESTGAGHGIIVRSPDGKRWRLGVDNAGTVVAAAA